MDIIKLVSKQTKVSEKQVQQTVALLEEGNTVPFIARYRKEMTGGLTEEDIRLVQETYDYQKGLQERKEEVHRLIEEQGKLTQELAEKITKATKLQQLEDIYRPFRPKRNTRASIAKELGLEPLAQMLLEQAVSWEELAQPFVNEKVEDIEKALQGAKDIIAEMITDLPENREFSRGFVFDRGTIETVAVDKEAQSPYEMYYEYSEPIKKLPPHRVMAMDRAEKEKFIKVSLILDKDSLVRDLWNRNLSKAPTTNEQQLKDALEDGVSRLLLPSVERDIRRGLTDNAQEAACKVFTANLKSLLLQPPTRNIVVLGLDPAYRTGCKLAVVDSTGKVLDISVIYPTPPRNQKEEGKKKILEFVDKYGITVIAIGNGTASRESAEFVAEFIGERENLSYTIVDEAGASVYSASPLAKEEYPDLDVAERSAISIARRLQDPLAELVRIPPQSIGVGQYQHDVDQKRLASLLGGVVEDCVNNVGADLNTASPSLLSYIAGIKPAQAKAIVKVREELGAFKARKDILKVPRLGKATYEQCAGFLRIKEGVEPLDSTSVHPESYEAAEKLIEILGYTKEELAKRGGLPGIRGKVSENEQRDLAGKLGIGVPTLVDILTSLEKPGLDPRESLPKPLFLSGVLKLEDLHEGMIVKGTVRNVVDFGAFVDIGVKEAGLIHISEMSEKFIKHPLEVVTVGDTVEARVIGVDPGKRRIALSLKGVI
ncbi:RNA-binding transcriptional accessory protein [Alkalicella caledoniensis]|uniref:RNA-binding transcriptional accessory protein n=1 Tax=Alkalicella caledoniensis TaxID=2731377 RepID=A0A7G9W7A4_ALKCA|nr:Tex family protein [Alkalicella caledoniensis]QNO14566.1 RNA-binding transcriptional accessory protein [Alkalicella caledoniensis]